MNGLCVGQESGLIGTVGKIKEENAELSFQLLSKAPVLEVPGMWGRLVAEHYSAIPNL